MKRKMTTMALLTMVFMLCLSFASYAASYVYVNQSKFYIDEEGRLIFANHANGRETVVDDHVTSIQREKKPYGIEELYSYTKEDGTEQVIDFIPEDSYLDLAEADTARSISWPLEYAMKYQYPVKIRIDSNVLFEFEETLYQYELKNQCEICYNFVVNMRDMSWGDCHFIIIYAIKYQVKSGDNLSSIAKKFSTTVEKIQKDNTEIKNPDKIFPNQLIKINFE